MVMTWDNLLSVERFGRTEPPGIEDDQREEFDRDHDRIMFSSAFRRLQDKTQVFPLSRNDFTRTRLTHSLEVSCVGRSLGRKANAYLLNEDLLPDSQINIGTIVASACLVHDIGNPPFGHSGESAIQLWAEKNLDRINSITNPQEKRDFLKFEGNAQGLRVITRIQTNRRLGGLQLTLATIGSMMKYPCGSLIENQPPDESRVEQKKFGFFLDDADQISKALRKLGMIEYKQNAFRRHPLSFLVEAADDICYAIVDLEDSVDQNIIDVKAACTLLEPLAQKIENYRDKGYQNKDRLHWLRTYAMQALINECHRVFTYNMKEILEGSFSNSLINVSCVRSLYSDIQDRVKQTAYKNPRVLTVEIAGLQVIGGLLDIFVPAILQPEKKEHQKLLEFISDSYLGYDRETHATVEKALSKFSPYQRLLKITDYISGMTDSFAVDLYQKLSGIKLPE
ncbi:deoxyguanosinetriphosphate triphosphohydrolase [Gimesia fumaroli]|uniref:Deoxyguanosinetriphosphate triphosphohydrolase n=1 Tax=Gimesia fumaroli TaxID=2527976 RepID=A0A518IHX5_9PLAN|nr:deoxyguanosinetriphosphate triphosphohydrolase [Gimesia fumaroli]QDV52688.1 Deoxyguanosinetriphosphate triphosphohydrolase [Gimesia fumaroli]